MKQVIDKNQEEEKNNEIKSFSKKYIDYLCNEYSSSPKSFYDFFDSSKFSNDCRSCGFNMDCGHSFISTYGEKAWSSLDGLKLVINKINDIQIIGSGLFSKWRYFNHWSYYHAKNDEIDWFILLLKRMQEVC